LFSGFEIITNLFKDKATVIYSEYETEGKVFKTKLTNKKVSEFTIPATFSSLIIDSKPQKKLTEIYGKIAIITNGYYSYIMCGT
jgi:hypothetical protein